MKRRGESLWHVEKKTSIYSSQFEIVMIKVVQLPSPPGHALALVHSPPGHAPKSTFFQTC